MRRATLGLALLALGACGVGGTGQNTGLEISGETRAGATSDVFVRPRARPIGFRERMEQLADDIVPDALRPVPRPSLLEGPLGDTIASLGDPNEIGLWLKTPLVTAATNGRIVNTATGLESPVQLLPLEDAAVSDSLISVSALEAIGASLDDQPTLQVFAGI